MGIRETHSIEDADKLLYPESRSYAATPKSPRIQHWPSQLQH